MTCEYCSLKCIASDCECKCHEEDRKRNKPKKHLFCGYAIHKVKK